jgi:uncharacterized protein YifE (UPF0438 family)
LDLYSTAVNDLSSGALHSKTQANSPWHEATKSEKVTCTKSEKVTCAKSEKMTRTKSEKVTCTKSEKKTWTKSEKSLVQNLKK